MKTIEDHAKNMYNTRIGMSEYSAITYTCEQMALAEAQALRVGIDIAQRWIPVEEELPELGVPVLLKFVNWTYGVGYYLQHKHRGCNFYSYIEPDIEFLFDAVTHWRPIELKQTTMKKLTREMLIIEPSENGQACITCPFRDGGYQTCREDALNHELSNQLDGEYERGLILTCLKHSITLKPEFK